MKRCRTGSKAYKEYGCEDTGKQVDKDKETKIKLLAVQEQSF